MLSQNLIEMSETIAHELQRLNDALLALENQSKRLKKRNTKGSLHSEGNPMSPKIFVVIRGQYPAKAFESKKEADSLAEKLNATVFRISLQESSIFSHPDPRLQQAI